MPVLLVPLPPEQLQSAYMLVALQGAPVLTGRLRSYLWVRQRLRRVEEALRANCSHWPAEGKAPICLQDAEPTSMKLALKRGPTHCLVWFGTGYDEVACTSPEPLTIGALANDIEKLPSASRPRVAIVCLQHGARRAAERLHVGGVASVFWLRAGADMSESAVLRVVIAPLLSMLETEPHGLEAIFRNECANLSALLGVVASPSSQPWLGLPVTDSHMAVKNDALQLHPNDLVDATTQDMFAALRDLQLCAPDVKHVEELRAKLVAENGPRGLAVWSAGKAEYSDAMAARCRTVALEAVEPFLMVGTAFELIWRISSDASLEEARAKVEQIGGSTPVLIWVDLVTEMSRAPLRTFLEAMLRNSAKAKAVFSCSAVHKRHMQELFKELCLNDLVRVKAVDEAEDVPASLHHDEPLRFTIERRGVPIDDPFATFHPMDLRRVIEEALGGERPLAALYLDDDAALLARISVTDPAFLHELRDRVLMDSFAADVSHRLCALDNAANLVAKVDMTAFAERYEQIVLRLDKLTRHQRTKLAECKGHMKVRIEAPAGGGKTFIALHEMLDCLQPQDDRDAEACVLFVAPHAALAHFVAAWIGQRLNDPFKRDDILARVWVFHAPFDQGVQRCGMTDEGRIVFKQDTLPKSFALVVVDEGHHIYKDPAVSARIEAHVTPTTRRLILTDVSQSLGQGIEYPDVQNCKLVVLDEVVRCSRRIVQAATAFQIGGQAKLNTHCHHGSDGPPLKSYLFDAPGGGAAGRFAAYAERTAFALTELVAAFPGLSLKGRVAILVPDDEFLAAFRPELLSALSASFGAARFTLMDAAWPKLLELEQRHGERGSRARDAL